MTESPKWYSTNTGPTDSKYAIRPTSVKYSQVKNGIELQQESVYLKSQRD